MHKQSLNVTVFLFDDIALPYVEGEDMNADDFLELAKGQLSLPILLV